MVVSLLSKKKKRKKRKGRKKKKVAIYNSFEQCSPRVRGWNAVGACVASERVIEFHQQMGLAWTIKIDRIKQRVAPDIDSWNTNRTSFRWTINRARGRKCTRLLRRRAK